VTELRRGLSGRIAQVNESGQPLYITRRGKIVAILLSIELYELMQRQREELVAQLRSAPPTPPVNAPNAQALRGALKGATVDEADYRSYLEEKYR
jgi:prevent-host-death family protein